MSGCVSMYFYENVIIFIIDFIYILFHAHTNKVRNSMEKKTHQH